jgi:hypothetical protein
MSPDTGINKWEFLVGGMKMLSRKIVVTVCTVVICTGLLAQADGPTNLAMNGTATASTTAYGGVAQNAINGNIGDFTHTAANDPNRWWEVDLGEDLILKQINIYNRASCCGERLNAAVLKVLDADRNEIYVSDPVVGAVTGGKYVYDNDGAGFAPVHYIRIEGGTEFLSLGEVEALPYWPFPYGPIPADGSVDVNDAGTLEWTEPDGAVSYNVYISEDDIIDQNDLAGQVTTPEYTVALEPGTKYFWSVEAVDSEGFASAGPVWSLTTLPLEAHFPNMDDGLGNVLPKGVVLGWTAGKGTLTHTVYFSADQALVEARDASVAIPFLDNASYEPGELEPGTTYYWAVDELWGVDPVLGFLTHPGPVWSFTTIGEIASITDDPNLVGLWTFDEGEHRTAIDWSGNGNHGVITGAQWIPGYSENALKFDGKSYVNLAPEAWDTINRQATVTAWMYIESGFSQNPVTFAAYQNPANGNSRVMSTHVVWGSTLYLDSGGDGVGYDRISKAASTADYADEWIHWAFVKNADTGDQQIYRNGMLWQSGTGKTKPMTGVTAFTIGSNTANTAEFWKGSMDDFRLYNKALSQAEIVQAMRANQARAWNPDPMRDAIEEFDGTTKTLSWTAGDAAVSHDVYFGQDRDAVADANLASPEYIGNQMETSLSVPDAVSFNGGNYYWRIDEVGDDGLAVQGELWKFRVIGITDKFESYADANNVHGQGGWTGWGGDAGAGAPLTSDPNFVYQGTHALEVVGTTDLVHPFDVTGGVHVFTVMQYIPSGATGTTYLYSKLLNQYGAENEWSIRTGYNMETGTITTRTGPTAATIVYDKWVALKYEIDLDGNTVVEYYNGVKIDTRVWDENAHATIGAIGLYGNGASSVYYDNITLN